MWPFKKIWRPQFESGISGLNLWQAQAIYCILKVGQNIDDVTNTKELDITEVGSRCPMRRTYQYFNGKTYDPIHLTQHIIFHTMKYLYRYTHKTHYFLTYQSTVPTPNQLRHIIEQPFTTFGFGLHCASLEDNCHGLKHLFSYIILQTFEEIKSSLDYSRLKPRF